MLHNQNSWLCFILWKSRALWLAGPSTGWPVLCWPARRHLHFGFHWSVPTMIRVCRLRNGADEINNIAQPLVASCLFFALGPLCVCQSAPFGPDWARLKLELLNNTTDKLPSVLEWTLYSAGDTGRPPGSRCGRRKCHTNPAARLPVGRASGVESPILSRRGAWHSLSSSRISRRCQWWPCATRPRAGHRQGQRCKQLHSPIVRPHAHTNRHLRRARSEKGSGDCFRCATGAVNRRHERQWTQFGQAPSESPFVGVWAGPMQFELAGYS